MNLEEFQKYCLSKPFVEQDMPFDNETLVYKVMGKSFAYTGLDNINPFWFNLKCDPERAIQLRAEHSCIKPGWHMNKKHWNTVEIDGSLSYEFICELIDHSYNLVVMGLKKAEKEKVLGAL